MTPSQSLRINSIQHGSIQQGRKGQRRDILHGNYLYWGRYNAARIISSANLLHMLMPTKNMHITRSKILCSACPKRLLLLEGRRLRTCTCCPRVLTQIDMRGAASTLLFACTGYLWTASADCCAQSSICKYHVCISSNAQNWLSYSTHDDLDYDTWASALHLADMWNMNSVLTVFFLSRLYQSHGHCV